MSETTSLVVDGEKITSEPLERGDVIRSGIIHINDRGIGDEPMAPFGGVTSSGYGKFGETAGIDSFTEQRQVTIQHTGRPTYPFQAPASDRGQPPDPLTLELTDVRFRI